MAARGGGTQPRKAIGRWIAAGRLIRMWPGVYALGHAAVGTRGRLIAALLYAGRGSALTGSTGARLWQVTNAPWAPIHIAAPQDRLSLPGLVVHRPRRFERVLLRGLPVTPLADTLLAFAAHASERQVRKALAEAGYRHKFNPLDAQRVLGRGRPGSALLRRSLDRHLPELARTRSPLEEDLLFLCERAGIPIPEVNVRVGPHRVDALWRAARVVVEVDGRDGHASLERRMTDHGRDMYLRTHGHLVLRYSRPQIRQQDDAVAAEIHLTLARRARTNRSA
jgi:hypothetical protein